MAQAALMAREYADWIRGAPHGPFDAALRLLRLADPVSVLDVGAGAGIYAKVCRRALPDVTYAACDASPAMVAWAREHIPGVTYDEADARRLPHLSRAYDLVLHGCCLIHLAHPLDWTTAIIEAARVARRWVLFHRTPLRPHGTDWRTEAQSDAYAGQTVSHTYVPERDFRAMVEGAGLQVLAEERWNRGQDPEQVSVLCRKPAGWEG